MLTLPPRTMPVHAPCVWLRVDDVDHGDVELVSLAGEAPQRACGEVITAQVQACADAAARLAATRLSVRSKAFVGASAPLSRLPLFSVSHS